MILTDYFYYIFNISYLFVLFLFYIFVTSNNINNNTTMEFITQIINQIIDSFDFGYCTAVNILTYLIIKFIDLVNGPFPITTWQKRIVLVFVIAGLSLIYYSIETNLKIIINSAILAPVFWSWICKPICNKIGIDYRKDIDILE